MKIVVMLTCHLLFPFDLGLELDFTGKDAREVFKEISARRMGSLSLDGRLFAGATFGTQVYKFGIGLIQISFSFEGDVSQAARLSCFAEQIRVGKTGILSYCQSLVEGLIGRAVKYATYRYERRLTDTDLFPAFVRGENHEVEGEPPIKTADTFIRRHQKALYGVVAGEPNYDALSDFVLERERLGNYGYYENEIILIKRFGAFVSSPEVPTILELIKLAYAQYWSLRAYNFILDHELDNAQRLLERLPPYYKFWVMPHRYQQFSREAVDFGKDKLAIVDSLYNVASNIPRIDSDWHLRTIYQSIEKVFNIDELYKTVEVKLERIEGSYNSARDVLATNFFILLDIIFFFALAWSVLDTFLLWKIFHK
ncbi:MAG: hypothetical protein HYZ73_02280 [Elusimicrobia bacterium]|nr:hypothetical protein [Elusimicrobiota bacterium]